MKTRHIFLSLAIVLLTSLQGTAAVTKTEYIVEEDILYRTDAGEYGSQMCRLDFYYPKGVKDFPTVVWFHGGGLTSGSKRIPDQLKDSGLGIIAVNYRLMPQVSVDECIDDAASAVAWAFREVASRGGSADLIFVAGHSAGGYLTDMVVLDKSRLEKYGIDADRIAGAFPYSAQKVTHYGVRRQQGVDELHPRLDETAPLFHMRKLPMPMLVLSGDRELELYGRYEEQAYFWRMMKLIGNDQIQLFEFDGFSHSEMAVPAHLVVKKFLKEYLKDRR